MSASRLVEKGIAELNDWRGKVMPQQGDKINEAALKDWIRSAVALNGSWESRQKKQRFPKGRRSLF